MLGLSNGVNDRPVYELERKSRGLIFVDGLNRMFL
jgi:hypothetical protein